MLFIFIIFFKVFAIPAWIVLIYWFALQVWMINSTPEQSGGVAVWAHIGGFILGMFLVWGLRQSRRPYDFWGASG